MAARRMTILLLAICGLILGASPKKHSKLTATKTVKSCDRTALQLKNCELKMDQYSIQIWKQKMSVNDKVNRDLVALPLSGEKVEWVSGTIEKLNDEHFVQWIAWEEPAADSQIQTKMWYVYRLNHEKAELVLSRPLVKRIKVENAKPKSDDEIQFGLRLEKKQLTWFAGKEKGPLK